MTESSTVIDVLELVMRFEATKGRFSRKKLAQEFAPLLKTSFGNVPTLEAKGFCDGFRAGQAWAGYSK